ncbi:MAG: hypothetical protein LC808_35930 [Actinobacteria bacterium]|nr:hypothetical protein [Actinomycetota bacterium]
MRLALSQFNGLRVRYNEIRIVSSSSQVDENARQMLIAAEEVLKSLRQGEGRESPNWRSADQMYERHRALFLDGVQRELGISRT